MVRLPNDAAAIHRERIVLEYVGGGSHYVVATMLGAVQALDVRTLLQLRLLRAPPRQMPAGAGVGGDDVLQALGLDLRHAVRLPDLGVHHVLAELAEVDGAGFVVVIAPDLSSSSRHTNELDHSRRTNVAPDLSPSSRRICRCHHTSLQATITSWNP